MEASLVAVKWCARGLSGAPVSSRFVPKPALATPGVFAASSVQSWPVVLPMRVKATKLLVLLELRSNNSFKPNLLRSIKRVA